MLDEKAVFIGKGDRRQCRELNQKIPDSLLVPLHFGRELWLVVGITATIIFGVFYLKISGRFNVPLVFVRRIVKILPVILVTLLIVTPFTIASEVADYLDELVYIELQISAVTTDMYLYLRWFPGKKEWIKEASIKAIEDLDEIKGRIAGSNPPQELAELVSANLNAIDELKEIYTGIESKKNENVKQEFVSFNELYSQFQEKLRDALKQYRHIQELPEDFDPLSEEVKGIKDEKDKNIYLVAVELIREKKYSEAYENLNKLREKYKSLTFEDCILLRMSDCLLMADSDLGVGEDKLESRMSGLELLSRILNKKEYSPVLYETFYKWRTTEQYFNHGMSNMSEIPNKDYNARRWEIIQLIKKYMKNEPGDMWARKQVDLLLSLPNITRGGPMGNHNIGHWGYSLYRYKNRRRR